MYIYAYEHRVNQTKQIHNTNKGKCKARSKKEKKNNYRKPVKKQTEDE